MVYGSKFFFCTPQKVLKHPVRNQASYNTILSYSFLLGHRLRINSNCDPWIGMKEQFLSRLDVDSMRSEHRCQCAPKRVETYPLRDAKLLQRRPDRAPQNRLR